MDTHPVFGGAGRRPLTKSNDASTRMNVVVMKFTLKALAVSIGGVAYGKSPGLDRPLYDFA